jgi:putative iron-only hydrogenase system regulator
MNMDTGKRLGFIGIIVENREKSAAAVNAAISDMAHIVVARVGLPYRERGCSVITLVVDATTDEVGSLTGRLGLIEGVSVKSGLSRGNL